MNRSQALNLLIDEAHRGEFHFPTSAKLAIKIKEVLDDPDCHLEAAAKLIQAEPLLAAKVISIANSVAFNPAGREITDVRTAASRLGVQTLRTLAMAYVARQMSGSPSSPDQQRLAAALWEHTAHVAALCHVIAGKVTKINPESALFAGLVHEIGGFYLLSRAEKYPVLLAAKSDSPDDIDLVSVENTLSLAVLRSLGIPDAVLDAVEQYAEGTLWTPLSTLGDTLMLADYMAPVSSPLAPADHEAGDVLIDLAVQKVMLVEILKESAEEVASLARALRG